MGVRLLIEGVSPTSSHHAAPRLRETYQNCQFQDSDGPQKPACRKRVGVREAAAFLAGDDAGDASSVVLCVNKNCGYNPPSSLYHVRSQHEQFWPARWTYFLEVLMRCLPLAGRLVAIWSCRLGHGLFTLRCHGWVGMPRRVKQNPGHAWEDRSISPTPMKQPGAISLHWLQWKTARLRDFGH